MLVIANAHWTGVANDGGIAQGVVWPMVSKEVMADLRVRSAGVKSARKEDVYESGG